MATKTLIPALKAKVGDWPYYICSMKYGSVAREVNFAFDLNNGNRELSVLLQRGLDERTGDIVKYLINNDSRFLGALIVAAWGGNPLYHPVTMNDPDGLLANLDSDFGVLEFNGSQQYFALDGQHRLKAIKDAMKQNPNLGNEDICVLIVSHFDDPDGRRRTRRLFTNINKHAKKTTKAEDIALDEDDAAAIVTRRLVMEHPYLKVDGRVRVITSAGDDGGLKLATGDIKKNDPTALFTMGGLYEIVKLLIKTFRLPAFGSDPTIRPSDETLDGTFDQASIKLDELLQCCGNIGEKISTATNVRDVRAPKDNEGQGHPFARAMIQRVVISVIDYAISQRLLTWDEIKKKLSKLDWRMEASPWESAAIVDGASVKMLTNRDHQNLLQKLLIAHLCPTTKSSIQKARSDYKKLRNTQYRITEEELLHNLIEPHGEIMEPEELSEIPEN